MKIFETQDYNQFKKLPGNRPVEFSHVEKLIKLISEKNMLSSNPMKVNNNLEIIDGQHRLEAARKRSWTIYYFIEEGTLHDAQLLNRGSKNWTPKDYLESYISLGNEHYIYLKSFMEKYNLSLGVSMRLLQGIGTHNEKGLDVFKAGMFKPKDRVNAETMAQRLLDMKDFVEPAVRRDREFIYALTKAYEIVKHKHLLKKMMQLKAKVQHQRYAKGYIRELEDIYNYRRHAKINFF